MANVDRGTHKYFCRRSAALTANLLVLLKAKKRILLAWNETGGSKAHQGV
jgi:hypothetical protein